MIKLQPDPRSIISFCDHIAAMCSKYESENKTPKEFVIDFVDEVMPEDCSLDVNRLCDNQGIISFGDAISVILKIYFYDNDTKRWH